MDASSYIDLEPNRNIPAFRVGDTVRVHATVVEGERRRIQAFEGVVIRRKRGGINSNFTVRRVSHGIGVERIFPFYSPLVEKVEVTRVGRVRQARLYYLRQRIGKAARLKAGARSRFEELTARPVLEEEEVMEEMAEDIEATGEIAAEEGAAEEGAEVEDAEASEEEAGSEGSGADASPAAEGDGEATDSVVEEPEAKAQEETSVQAEAPAEEASAESEDVPAGEAPAEDTPDESDAVAEAESDKEPK